MREIEVKAKVSDINKVVDSLKGLEVSFSPSVFQKDVIFVKNPGDLDTYLSNKHFLRVRTVDDNKHIFNLKMNGENSLSKTEYETEVSSKEEIVNILTALDFKVGANTDKTRRVAKYNDMEICIDEVSDLGVFIEVERIADDGDVELIQEEMFGFLESIGVSREDRVFEGYDIMLLKKKFSHK